MEGRPWPEYGANRQPLTSNALARLLNPFKIKPTMLRFHVVKNGGAMESKPVRAICEASSMTPSPDTFPL
jgi:hypothetical protein